MARVRKRVRKPSGLLTVSYIADDFDTPDLELDRLYEGECGAEA